MNLTFGEASSPLALSEEHNSYEDELVQQLIRSSFMGLLPSARWDGGSGIHYFFEHSTHSVCLATARPVDLGAMGTLFGELLKRGWGKMKAMLQRGNYSPEVQAKVLNFSLPDPRRGADRYCSYMDPHAQQCLAIFWAGENRETPFVPIDEVISYFLSEVPENEGSELDVVGQARKNFSKPLVLGVGAMALLMGVSAVTITSSSESAPTQNQLLPEGNFAEVLNKKSPDEATSLSLESEFSLQQILLEGETQVTQSQDVNLSSSEVEVATHSMILK